MEMTVYECTECKLKFAVDSRMDVEQIVCPDDYCDSVDAHELGREHVHVPTEVHD